MLEAVVLRPLPSCRVLCSCEGARSALWKLLLEGDSFFFFFLRDKKKKKPKQRNPPNKVKMVFCLYYPVSLYFGLEIVV